MGKFKVGDKVKIVKLVNSHNGIIGHVGTITEISVRGYHTLDPYCVGSAWLEEELEMVESPYSNITSPNTKSLHDLFEEKVKTLRNEQAVL